VSFFYGIEKKIKPCVILVQKPGKIVNHLISILSDVFKGVAFYFFSYK